MALVQGGAGFHILSQSVFNYVSGMSISEIVASVDEVPDLAVREAISEDNIIVSLLLLLLLTLLTVDN